MRLFLITRLAIRRFTIGRCVMRWRAMFRNVKI